jgi:hypothetical protein
MELQSTEVKRIAMWAVPRSMATALLRAWQNRSDTVVWDEPLLPAYVNHYGYDLGFTREDLQGTELETDYHTLVAQLTGPLPPGKTVSYQKHQPHNLAVEIIGRQWLQALENCFLIRRPREMLLSLQQLAPGFTLEQTGWPQLGQLFEHCRETNARIPPVIDARDLQDAPRHTLTLLCEAVGVPFCEAMLQWPAQDVQALPENERIWYAAAWRATGFEPYRPTALELPASLQALCEECEVVYQRLYRYRLH